MLSILASFRSRSRSLRAYTVHLGAAIQERRSLHPELDHPSIEMTSTSNLSLHFRQARLLHV